MPQRINTLRRKITNRNDTYQMHAVSAAPIGGSINISTQLTQGLRPGLCRSAAPKGAYCPTAPTIPQFPQIPPIPHPIQSQSNKYKNTNEYNNPFTNPNIFNEHNTTTQHRKRPIRRRAPTGRYSRIAQGGMRAKPDMEPWGNRKSVQ